MDNHGAAARRSFARPRSPRRATSRGERGTDLQHDKSPDRGVQAVRNSAVVSGRPGAAPLQRKDGRPPPLVIAPATDSGAAVQPAPRAARRAQATRLAPKLFARAPVDSMMHALA